MQNIRPISKRSEWNLSKHEFYTAYHYAMQYSEWKDRIDGVVGLKAVNIDGMPHGSTVGNPTESQAIKCADWVDKINLVEQTVKETDPELYQWLLVGVTREGITYNYLKMVMGMPCGKNYYYDKRRKFYFLLNKKIGA